MVKKLVRPRSRKAVVSREELGRMMNELKTMVKRPGSTSKEYSLLCAVAALHGNWPRVKRKTWERIRGAFVEVRKPNNGKVRALRCETLPAKLTDLQYLTLAEYLTGTTSSVYVLADALFEHEWQDEDFARLGDVAEVFQCRDCDEWKSTEERAGDFRDVCENCLASLDSLGEKR